MMRVRVDGVGITGPGLDGWASAASLLRGERPYAAADMRNPAPAVLAPGERRRASLAVRLAIEVASQAVTASGLPPSRLPAVFASSDGDGDTIHSICAAIAAPGYPVSPTRFHNSVHNAAAGYWSIAVGSRQASTSLCAWDDTFAVAFLDAAAQVMADGEPVLLVVSDVAAPEPLNRERPGVLPFGCAMVLSAAAAGDAAAVDLRFSAGSAPLVWPLQLPEGLTSNPAARALLLLRAIARDEPAVVRLPYGSQAHLEMRFGANS